MSVRLLLFWSAFIVILGPHNTYGFLSMETFFQKLTQTTTKKQLEPSGNYEGASNLYQQTINNIVANSTSSSLKTIADITKNIETFAQEHHYNCTISNNDTFTILAHEPNFLADLYLNANIDLGQSLAFSGNLRKACQTVLSCLGAIAEDDSIHDNTIQLQSCKSSILNTYKHNSSTIESLSDIPLNNNSNNIFMDNNKDNGLFDLFIDLQHIEELLFKPGEQGPSLPKMIGYTLPTTQQNRDNGMTNKLNANSINNSTQVGSTHYNTTKNPQGAGTQPAPSLSTTQTQHTASLQYHIQEFINQHTILPSNQDGKTYITPYMCLPEEQPGLGAQTTLSGSDSSSTGSTYNDAIDDFTKLQNDLINAVSPYLYNNQGGGGNTAGFGQNFINPAGALPQTTQACKTSCAESQGLEKMICEGKCCINSCNQTSDPAKKALCISQCLCGEASVANDMLRIKICRVPAQPAQVAAGKTITSIEQAVEEINQIFLKLKNNGALIKRTKTTEFLDSSFSSIKLHKVLAFDIFVVIKPIYDILDMRREKENSITTHDKLALLNHTSGTLGKGADKNKYNTTLVGDTTQLQKQCQQLGQSYNIDTKQCDSPHDNQPTQEQFDNTAIIRNLAATHSITTTNDMIATFLKDHYQFWQETAKQISDLQISTANLRAKAEQAK